MLQREYNVRNLTQQRLDEIWKKQPEIVVEVSQRNHDQ